MPPSRALRDLFDPNMWSRGISYGRQGDNVVEKLLSRKLCLDDRLILTLSPHLSRFTSKDCLKVLSLSKVSSLGAFFEFISNVNTQLFQSLALEPLETTALVISSLGRLGDCKGLQSICDSHITPDRILSFSVVDSVNILNVLTRHKINSKFIDTLINRQLANMSLLDHRLASLLIASISRTSFSLPTDRIDKWALTQLTELWTPQSLSLFVYSMTKLGGWKKNDPVDVLINTQLSKCDLTDFSVQNMCLTLVGNPSISILNELCSRKVPKKDWLFLLSHIDNDPLGIKVMALDRVLASGALNNGDWKIISQHVDLSDEKFHHVSLPVLFYLISQTNFLKHITWDKYTLPPIDAKTASRILQTIARLERRDVPNNIIIWAIDSLSNSSPPSAAILGLVSLTMIENGLILAKPKLINIIQSIKTVNSVDLRQLNRFIVMIDDENILDMLKSIIPDIHIIADLNISPPRSSRSQSQVHATLKSVVSGKRIICELEIPEIATLVDLVIR